MVTAVGTRHGDLEVFLNHLDNERLDIIETHRLV